MRARGNGTDNVVFNKSRQWVSLNVDSGIGEDDVATDPTPDNMHLPWHYLQPILKCCPPVLTPLGHLKDVGGTLNAPNA